MKESLELNIAMNNSRNRLKQRQRNLKNKKRKTQKKVIPNKRNLNNKKAILKSNANWQLKN